MRIFDHKSDYLILLYFFSISKNHPINIQFNFYYFECLLCNSNSIIQYIPYITTYISLFPSHFLFLIAPHLLARFYPSFQFHNYHIWPPTPSCSTRHEGYIHNGKTENYLEWDKIWKIISDKRIILDKGFNSTQYMTHIIRPILNKYLKKE